MKVPVCPLQRTIVAQVGRLGSIWQVLFNVSDAGKVNRHKMCDRSAIRSRCSPTYPNQPPSLPLPGPHSAHRTAGWTASFLSLLRPTSGFCDICERYVASSVITIRLPERSEWRYVFSMRSVRG